MSKIIPFKCYICEREIGNPSTETMLHGFVCSICNKPICFYDVKFKGKEVICIECFEKKV